MLNVMLMRMLFIFVWNLWKLICVHQKASLCWLILSWTVVQTCWLICKWTWKLWTWIIEMLILDVSSVDGMRIPWSLSLFIILKVQYFLSTTRCTLMYWLTLYTLQLLTITTKLWRKLWVRILHLYIWLKLFISFIRTGQWSILWILLTIRVMLMMSIAIMHKSTIKCIRTWPFESVTLFIITYEFRFICWFRCCNPMNMSLIRWIGAIGLLLRSNSCILLLLLLLLSGKLLLL